MADPTNSVDVELFRELFAQRLVASMGERSLRSVAAAAGITHPTLHRLLRGQVLPDVQTIIRLEAALEVDLWPSRDMRRGVHDEQGVGG